MATLTGGMWNFMADGGTGIYDNVEYYVMKADDREVLLRKPYGKPVLFYKGMLGNGWVKKEVSE